MVQAAVVNTWGSSPQYQTYDLPPPTATQVRIKVLSAGLPNLVRSRAAGQHFTVAGTSPPHIPGTDGVGTLIPSGELVYFNALTAPTGSFAQEINVEKRDAFRLPEGSDPDEVAVLVNAVMSSWMAFSTRVGIQPGARKGLSVAVVGATGVSGQAAVQVARAMGAESVVAIGKPGLKLEKTREVGATALVPLSERRGDMDFGAAADADIVLDYLWGDVAEAVLPGIVEKRKDKSKRLDWVQIGTLAGDDAKISGALLRKANVALLGCGPGSWSFQQLGAQMPKMLEAIVVEGMKGEYQVERLEEVERWWGETKGARKLVKM
ncbi:hypothetical protein E8E13_007325 [Curvularia kusanoi]|uniref:Uncharacterized protein n=1 Tax=Curvularia kusanoi TaxID=90978 RepID=A0A9P4WA60_CURKU|nr:hypothetical protein E8E13_007325 [Curvularia kusanoi]